MVIQAHSLGLLEQGVEQSKITDAEAYVRRIDYSSDDIKNIYSSINLNNLIEHSYNFDYTIYEMYEDKKYKKFQEKTFKS